MQVGTFKVLSSDRPQKTKLEFQRDSLAHHFQFPC